MGDYQQHLFESGSLILPKYLFMKSQELNLSPEALGYLCLALSNADKPEDKWVGWALQQGWAKWAGDRVEKKVTFSPLWRALQQIWEKETDERLVQGHPPKTTDFDFGKIIKSIDGLRGTLSVSSREQQFIQEMNLRYSWSTEFIITFFQLCFQRGLTQLRAYRPIAQQVQRAGLFTLEDLTAFMNNVDWISQKVGEIKKDYLGLYGMVTVTERDMYVKWNMHWKMNHGVIVRAAQEAASANHGSFRYVDRVLEDWHEKGVDSLEAAENAIERHTLATRNIQEAKRIDSKTVTNIKLSNQRMVKRDNKNWQGLE